MITYRTRMLWLRGVWIALALLSVIIIVTGMPDFYNRLRSVCQSGTCTYFQLLPADIGALAQLNLSLTWYAGYFSALIALTTLVSLAIASILFWWNSSSSMAIFTSFTLIGLPPTFFYALTEALIDYHPAWRIPVGVLQATGTISLIVFSFIFPKGSFYPRWTRWFVLLLVALSPSFLLTTSVMDYQQGVSSPLQLILVLLLILCIVVGMVAQFSRYRRESSAVERQQIKWIILGIAMFSLISACYLLLSLFIPAFRQPGTPKVLYYLIGAGFNDLSLVIFLVALAISILRYRLWEIDVIIRRSLIYGLLTGLLALIYFASVVVTQQVARGKNPVVTVLTTLLLAGLFTPLRRRVQDFIDRSFYRRKYDAAATLARFTASARDEVDMDRLSQALLLAVKETVQPSRVSLWLRSSAMSRGEWREMDRS